MIPIPVRLGHVDIDRFWKKVAIGGADECWLWQGAPIRGYGRIKIAGEMLFSHRVAWVLTHGPTDREIVHYCDNGLCCNPSHLMEGLIL